MIVVVRRSATNAAVLIAERVCHHGEWHDMADLLDWPVYDKAMTLAKGHQKEPVEPIGGLAEKIMADVTDELVVKWSDTWGKDAHPMCCEKPDLLWDSYNVVSCANCGGVWQEDQGYENDKMEGPEAIGHDP